MNDRESPFSRAQPSRSSFRGQTVRKAPVPSASVDVERKAPSRQGKDTISPRPSRRLMPSHATLEHLKQWELVEGERGMRVIEKKNPAPKEGTIGVNNASSANSATNHGNFGEKLKPFEEPKIAPPIRLARQDAGVDSKVPISLDLILKQRKGSALESTDMLQKLEQQVKAIEIGTLAARTRHLENSSDFGPEIQLRYREHEDLLRNVTDDDEPEG